MVTMKLYSFAKNRNSTKKVTSSTPSVEYTGILVEPCSILEPVVKLEADSPWAYNYAWISEFSRYYFITDFHTENGFWYVHMSIDVLGTYKTQIGSSTQYILRSKAKKNEYIVDTLYPTTGSVTKSVVEIMAGLNSYLPNGIFVLNVTGSVDATCGSYACDWTTFKNVISEMLMFDNDNTLWANLAQGIRNSLSKPFEHLGNVIWFPADYIDLSGITASTSLTLGHYQLVSTASKPMSFYYLSSPSSWASTSLSLPKHPDAATNGKYMNLKPFTQYIYRDDIFGDIELDPLKLIDTSTFQVYKTTDPATGLQVVTLPDGQTRTGQVGVMISMENNSLNIGGFLSGVASTIAAAATGNYLAAAGSAMSACDNLLPTVTSSSQQGSTVLTWSYVTLDCYFWATAAHDNTNLGSPYYTSAKISTCGGYNICDHARISATTMTDTEQRMIIDWMESGFYYE